jgi:hypothetical protein
MKRVRLNKLIISLPFVAGAANAQGERYFLSYHLHSFLSAEIFESISVNNIDADVIYKDVFTTIQLTK